MKIDSETTRFLSISDLIAAGDTRTDSRSPVLVIIQGNDIGRVYELHAERVVVGRSANCAIHLNQVGVSRSHAVLYRDDDGVLYVNDLRSTNGTYVNGEKINSAKLSDGDKLQFGTTTVLKFSYQDRLDEAFHKTQYDNATRDGLTGCVNKRSFQEQLAAEIQAASVAQRPLTLAMMDVDHFKLINDTYGHDCGDEILKGIAKALESNVRQGDVVARYGGEEFAVIMRETDGEHASRAAERLRAAVENLKTEYDGKTIPVTISIGVTTWDGFARRSSVDIIKSADARLYQAKRGGRNQVCSGGI